MSSRKENRASGKPPWSPFGGKGLLEEVPLHKRRRLGRDTSAMGRLAAPSVRSRRALSDANAGQVVGESMSNASSNNEGLGTEDGGLVEFRKEDVNALLNEKIKGKRKFDFKGECEMKTEYIRKLRACVKWYMEQEELHDAEREKHAKTVGIVNERNQQLEELTCTIDELRKKTDKQDSLTKVKTLIVEDERYKEEIRKSIAELECSITKAKWLEERYKSQKEQIRMLEQQLKIAREEKQMFETSVSDMKQDYEDRKKEMRELESVLAEKELVIFEGELVRKKLHNTILELKGNIRVFCRVRPVFPGDECSGGETTAIAYPSSAELLGRGIELVQNPGQKHSFSFDKVFNPEASQEDVFTEISELVQSALDGYKVCIFAYGQTGSGKTYTMMGGTEAPEQKGLIPRSLEQIFQSSQSLSSQGWTFKMEASMLEIYNETIRDLLSPSRASSYGTSRPENPCVRKQYTIKHDANGNTTVSDLTIVEVCSLKEVQSLFHRAAQIRSVSRTQMNEQSSRSHCVFTLRILEFNASTKQQINGVLNLIDLAGSERLSKSGSTGERLKETQAINKSLSCLGDVILAISNRDAHVPFRNSKLTYLLQPCLGGDSKTLMFVNISPIPSSVNESLCSLRFAAKVNGCKIGVPRRRALIRPDARLSRS